MPKKSSNPTPTASKTGHVVPEWAKKVKGYRENAKKTQVEVGKAIKATANTLSLVENGRREFIPTQRNHFFELIGQPEDSSIPTTVRDLVPSDPKKATKPAKPVAKRKTKSTKPAKAAKVAKESEPALVASLQPTSRTLNPLRQQLLMRMPRSPLLRSPSGSPEPSNPLNLPPFRHLPRRRHPSGLRNLPLPRQYHPSRKQCSATSAASSATPA
jgi:DNA-binding XRE family transcriptional regulator